MIVKCACATKMNESLWGELKQNIYESHIQKSQNPIQNWAPAMTCIDSDSSMQFTESVLAVHCLPAMVRKCDMVYKWSAF